MWTRSHHFLPSGVPTHATIPICRGPWHNRTGHFVTFYMCPKYWSILDPLKDALLESLRMQLKLHKALRESFTYRNLPTLPLPAYRQLPRIAIQRDAPGPYGHVARSRCPPHCTYSLGIYPPLSPDPIYHPGAHAGPT